MKISRIGETFVNKKGESYKIIEYLEYTNCTVQFEDGTIVKNLIYQNIKNGEVKNPNRPNMYGVGYMGQGIYKAGGGNSKHTKCYLTWYSMFNRCYNPTFHKKEPTYKDCVVDERWHNFQVFAEWFEQSYIEGYHLDKDILFKGNKIYSPETCCFVPQEINQLFTAPRHKKDGFPKGISKKSNKFCVMTPSNNGNNYMGTFHSIEEAIEVYRIAKQKYIVELTIKWENILPENIINKIKI
jgi:hypothetical protein